MAAASLVHSFLTSRNLACCKVVLLLPSSCIRLFFCLLGIRGWTEALYMLSMCSTAESHPQPPRDFCKLNVIVLILCIKPLVHLALLPWKKPTFQGWRKRLCAHLVSFLTIHLTHLPPPPVLTMRFLSSFNTVAYFSVFFMLLLPLLETPV